MKKFIFHIAEKSLRESVPTVTKDRSSCESRRLAQDSGTNSKMLGCDRVPINRDRDGSSQSQKLRKRDISFDVCSPNNGRFFYAPKPDRMAISALCQYTVIAIGLSLLFKVLGVDWAKLGWIAAALSVGIGFGLQEVVANFVCGIIVLFERPIRVGDFVTVDGTIGTVTKIRIRATTITNEDPQIN